MLLLDVDDVDDVDDVVGVVGETSLSSVLLMMNVEQSWQCLLLHRTQTVRPSVWTEPRTAPDTETAHSAELLQSAILISNNFTVKLSAAISA